MVKTTAPIGLAASAVLAAVAAHKGGALVDALLCTIGRWLISLAQSGTDEGIGDEGSKGFGNASGMQL